MQGPREAYAPRPPPPRVQTDPHDPGRGERAETTPPRPEEVFVLGLRPDRPDRGRQTVGGDRAPPRREPGGESAPAGGRARPRADRPEEGVAGLLRRVVHPRAPRARGHGRPRPRGRGCSARPGFEGREQDEGPAGAGPRGYREAAADPEG